MWELIVSTGVERMYRSVVEYMKDGGELREEWSRGEVARKERMLHFEREVVCL